MRHAIGLSALTILISATALADAPKQAPKDTPAPAASLTDRARFLDPIQVESLAIVPIVSTEPPAKGEDLLVLDEAMAKKLVRIKEVEDGEVNSLTLSNTSSQSLFLLAGEVIIGGKQDRIIGRNTIVPGKTTLAVPVFCVEHGRWEGDSKEFTTAKALAHGRLRGQASFGGQQEVWDEVAAKNEKDNTATKTGTYRKVAQKQADGTLDKWEKRVTAGLDKLSADDKAHLVGFAVAVNGQIATIDVFSAPALFGKLEGKLVRSYITDAVDVPAAKDAKAPTAEQVKAFIADADKAKEQSSYDTEMAATSVQVGEHNAKARVDYKPAKAATKGDGSAPPVAAAPAVYETITVK